MYIPLRNMDGSKIRPDPKLRSIHLKAGETAPPYSGKKVEWVLVPKAEMEKMQGV